MTLLVGSVVLGVLLVVAIITPLVLKATPSSSCSSTKVSITSPSPESRVQVLTTVRGTACHIQSGEALWVLVVPDGVSGYFPQNGPVIVTSDGTWSASAHIGVVSDPAGQGFEVIAALADQAGNAAIRTYFAQPSTTVGLDPLPGGIQLLAQEHVVRK
jgi:hypothetical protein